MMLSNVVVTSVIRVGVFQFDNEFEMGVYRHFGNAVKFGSHPRVSTHRNAGVNDRNLKLNKNEM